MITKHYRQEEEVVEWRKKDPVDRLRKFMMNKGYWDEEHEAGAWKHAEEIVEAAVQEFEKTPNFPPEELFDYLYEELPPLIQKQRKEFLDFIKKGESQ